MCHGGELELSKHISLEIIFKNIYVKCSSDHPPTSYVQILYAILLANQSKYIDLYFQRKLTYFAHFNLKLNFFFHCFVFLGNIYSKNLKLKSIFIDTDFAL